MDRPYAPQPHPWEMTYETRKHTATSALCQNIHRSLMCSHLKRETVRAQLNEQWQSHGTPAHVAMERHRRSMHKDARPTQQKLSKRSQSQTRTYIVTRNSKTSLMFSDRWQIPGRFGVRITEEEHTGNAWTMETFFILIGFGS